MALSAIEHQTLCLPAPAAPQTFGSGSVLGLLCWHGIRANLSRLPAHRTRPVSCRASGLWSGFESRARAVTVHFHGRGIGHGVLHMAYCISGWSLTASKSFLPDMALPPSRKRLKTVLHLPNSSSQSRQGLSVHTIHGTTSANQAPVRASWPCIARLAQAVRGHQCPLLVAQYSSFHGGIAAQKEDSQQA